MGIIDSAWYRFKCPQCGTTETVVAHDYGSSFGGSRWQTLGAPPSFEIVSTGGGREEPEVTAARCKTCEVAALFDSGYGTSPRD